MVKTGKIIVLAYPDTYVTMSDEWICRFLPLVGLGTREYIKAGHAALVLVENTSGKADYFDFGRYITPAGAGRVRGANTDAELHIPFKAQFSAEGAIANLNDFLLWLDANPEKTHGEGRLLASVCEEIDYDRAFEFILRLQKRGSIPYGAFHKTGSNCSRFVTDTILSATAHPKIKRALRFNKKFTPSTVGNVEKSTFGPVYEVSQGQVSPFTGTAFKENLKNYFDTKRPPQLSLEERLNGKMMQLPVDAHRLEGIGSGAWFVVDKEAELPKHHFRIKRINDQLEVDYDGIFQSEEFDPKEKYTFTYDSHCGYCHVIQQGIKIRLEGVGAYRKFKFNSWQKAHSA